MLYHFKELYKSYILELYALFLSSPVSKWWPKIMLIMLNDTQGVSPPPNLIFERLRVGIHDLAHV